MGTELLRSVEDISKAVRCDGHGLWQQTAGCLLGNFPKRSWKRLAQELCGKLLFQGGAVLPQLSILFSVSREHPLLSETAPVSWQKISHQKFRFCWWGFSAMCWPNTAIKETEKKENCSYSWNPRFRTSFMAVLSWTHCRFLSLNLGREVFTCTRGNSYGVLWLNLKMNQQILSSVME